MPGNLVFLIELHLVVWVAGGVGMTPFLGASISELRKGAPTPHLFYCVPSRHIHVEGFDIRSGIGPDLSRDLDDLVRTQLRRFTSQK